MKTPEVGDRFTISGVVTGKGTPNYFYGIVDGEQVSVAHYMAGAVFESPPWAPKVGEEVDIDGMLTLPERGYTVLAIHGDGGPFHNGDVRSWSVVAYGSDRPKVFFTSELRERVKS